jgi:hypothetical protein
MNEIALIPIIPLAGGGCCCFLFLLIVGFVVYKLMSKKNDAPPASSAPAAPMNTAAPGNPSVQGSVSGPAVGRVAQYGTIITRVTDDGFWIANQFLTAGSVVHYRYRSGSDWIVRTVVYQPGADGQFVHVGAAAQNLQVIDVVPPAGATESEDPLRTMVMGTSPFAQQQPGSGTPPAQ